MTAPLSAVPTDVRMEPYEYERHWVRTLSVAAVCCRNMVERERRSVERKVAENRAQPDSMLPVSV